MARVRYTEKCKLFFKLPSHVKNKESDFAKFCDHLRINELYKNLHSRAKYLLYSLDEIWRNHGTEYIGYYDKVPENYQYVFAIFEGKNLVFHIEYIHGAGQFL